MLILPIERKWLNMNKELNKVNDKVKDKYFFFKF